MPIQSSIHKLKQRSTFFTEFAKSQEFAGVLLLVVTAASLFLANAHPVEILHAKSLHVIINDGLMAVFFLLVGLEIKRELLVGELSTRQLAALPIMGALGGMLVPAGLFFLFNHSRETANGWAIPTATDIAFAVGILNLVGKHVPKSLQVFITALAVVDDLGAVIIIALFYSSNISLVWLAALLVAIVSSAFAFKQWRQHTLILFILSGVLFFYLLHQAHLHTTLAGVLLAAVTPFDNDEATQFVHRVERALQKPVQFLILPLFAFVNTFIVIQFDAEKIHVPLMLGIVVGLVFGKPLGISLFSWMATKLKWASLPEGVHMRDLITVSILGGIGFTMSIFISLLAFTDITFMEQSKTFVLLASMLSMLLGFAIMKRKFR